MEVMVIVIAIVLAGILVFGLEHIKYKMLAKDKANFLNQLEQYSDKKISFEFVSNEYYSNKIYCRYFKLKAVGLNLTLRTPTSFGVDSVTKKPHHEFELTGAEFIKILKDEQLPTWFVKTESLDF